MKRGQDTKGTSSSCSSHKGGLHRLQPRPSGPTWSSWSVWKASPNGALQPQKAASASP